MQISITTLAAAAWLLFLFYWLWSARRVKSSARGEPVWSRFFKYWLPIIVNLALMFPTRLYEGTLLGMRFVPDLLWLASLGLLLAVAGLLLALVGTALLLGEWRAVLGFVIMFVSFWRKLRLEETWLSEYFGPKYGEYMQRVKALIPGVL